MASNNVSMLFPVIKTVYVRMCLYSDKTHKPRLGLIAYTDKIKNNIPYEISDELIGKNKIIRHKTHSYNQLYYNYCKSSQAILVLQGYKKLIISPKNYMKRKMWITEADVIFPEGYILENNIQQYYNGHVIINLPKNFIGTVDFSYYWARKGFCCCKIYTVVPGYYDGKYKPIKYNKIFEIRDILSAEINFVV